MNCSLLMVQGRALPEHVGQNKPLTIPGDEGGAVEVKRCIVLLKSPVALASRGRSILAL